LRGVEGCVKPHDGEHTPATTLPGAPLSRGEFYNLNIVN
jgi:hypothetical protein